MKSMLQTRHEALASGRRSPFLQGLICTHPIGSRGVVREGSAILLLALFGLLLVSPLVFASGADSRLPVCCRRNGAHHCMMMADLPLSGAVWQAAPCRFFPAAQVAPVPVGTGLPKVSDCFGLAFSQPPRRTLAEVRLRASVKRSHQKRGPPSLLS
jgi:hypothetical protein